MRILAIALAFLALSAPASAQKPDSAPAPTASDVAPEHLAAAHDLYRSLVFDNGLLETLSNGISARAMPEIRASLLDSPMYRSVSRESQQRLTTFTDSLPEMMLAEINTMFDEIGQRSAPRFAQRLSADELTQIAGFMRSPETLAKWHAMFQSFLDANMEGSTGSFPDWSRSADGTLNAFATSSAGQALLREEDAIGDILEQEINNVMPVMLPRIQARVIAGICDALQSECPPSLRAMVGRT